MPDAPPTLQSHQNRAWGRSYVDVLMSPHRVIGRLWLVDLERQQADRYACWQ